MNSIMFSAFIDEMTKLAEEKIAMAAPAAALPAAEAAAKKQPFLIRNAKPLGLMALGAGLHSVGQDVYNDYRTGRAVRQQNGQMF